MRIVNFETRGVLGIAADEGSGWHGLTQRDSGFPGTLPELIAQERRSVAHRQNPRTIAGNRPEHGPAAAAGARTAENSVRRSQLR